MSALKQYLDLYDAHQRVIEAPAPAAMNAVRRQARQALATAVLPRKGQEGYEQFSVDEAFAPDYGLNIERKLFNIDVSKVLGCEIPKVSTLLCATVNDIFAPSKRLLTGLPEGVTVCPLSKADPKILEEYYGTVADMHNAATALNTLLAQDGILVHCRRDVRMDRPIQIVNFMQASFPLMVARRVLVVLEENAYCQVVVCDHSRTLGEDNGLMNSQVTEVILKPGATLHYCELEETAATNTRVATLFASQSEGSHLNIGSATLRAGHTRNYYEVGVHGNDCENAISGMVIGSGTMVVDNSTRVNIKQPHCNSNQLFKYIIDDKAQGAFEGTICVDETATHTNAQQTNRNILASADARMHAKPQLEIYCDEVKCGHGSTTGQLDQRALFYMRQRGIPEAEAKTMLMQAFMADVIDSITIEGLRDRLRHLVDRRLAGDCTALCSDCALE